jgi:hypothetical protein
MKYCTAGRVKRILSLPGPRSNISQCLQRSGGNRAVWKNHDVFSSSHDL